MIELEHVDGTGADVQDLHDQPTAAVVADSATRRQQATLLHGDRSDVHAEDLDEVAALERAETAADVPRHVGTIAAQEAVTDGTPSHPADHDRRNDQPQTDAVTDAPVAAAGGGAKPPDRTPPTDIGGVADGPEEEENEPANLDRVNALQRYFDGVVHGVLTDAADRADERMREIAAHETAIEVELTRVEGDYVERLNAVEPASVPVGDNEVRRYVIDPESGEGRWQPRTVSEIYGSVAVNVPPNSLVVAGPDTGPDDRFVSLRLDESQTAVVLRNNYTAQTVVAHFAAASSPAIIQEVTDVAMAAAPSINELSEWIASAGRNFDWVEEAYIFVADDAAGTPVAETAQVVETIQTAIYESSGLEPEVSYVDAGTAVHVELRFGDVTTTVGPRDLSAAYSPSPPEASHGSPDAPLTPEDLALRIEQLTPDEIVRTIQDMDTFLRSVGNSVPDLILGSAGRHIQADIVSAFLGAANYDGAVTALQGAGVIPWRAGVRVIERLLDRVANDPYLPDISRFIQPAGTTGAAVTEADAGDEEMMAIGQTAGSVQASAETDDPAAEAQLGPRAHRKPGEIQEVIRKLHHHLAEAGINLQALLLHNPDLRRLVEAVVAGRQPHLSTASMLKQGNKVISIALARLPDKIPRELVLPAAPPAAAQRQTVGPDIKAWWNTQPAITRAAIVQATGASPDAISSFMSGRTFLGEERFTRLLEFAQEYGMPAATIDELRGRFAAQKTEEDDRLRSARAEAKRSYHQQRREAGSTAQDTEQSE